MAVVEAETVAIPKAEEQVEVVLGDLISTGKMPKLIQVQVVVAVVIV